MNKEKLYEITLKMLNDKYNIKEYNFEDFNDIYNSFSNDENLNKNVLTKINDLFKNSNGIIDNDILNKKIREYELSRKNVSVQLPLPIEQPLSSPLPLNILQQPPVQMQPSQQKYKTFVINSINRDWVSNPNINNLKINIPSNINILLNDIYADCLCLHKNIKNITPYVIMNISDNVKNYQVIFICKSHNNNWDIWYPTNSDNYEIDLSKKTWTITLFDFNNKELNIGYDNIQIIEINNHKEHYYKFKLSNYKLNLNDNITIKLYDSTIIKTEVIEVLDNSYIIDKNNVKIEQFINSHILNDMKQYSFILKYTSK
jgi:hypothetical protein